MGAAARPAKTASVASSIPPTPPPRGLLGKGWSLLRRVSGDDAYERYLTHWREQHHGQGQPMDRKSFHGAEVQRRWNGIRRCC